MSEDNTIEVVEIRETQYDDEAVIDSPYEARHAIKFLPWKAYSKEVAEHGSLKGKAQSRGTNTKTGELITLFSEMERYGFSDSFSVHQSWDGDALDGDGARTIAADAVTKTADFWEYLGYDVVIPDHVERQL